MTGTAAIVLLYLRLPDLGFICRLAFIIPSHEALP